jgi:hypothetical protein
VPVELTKEQKEHLNVCVEDVKKEMYSKLKVPLFGLIGVFAVGVSIFATYLYMQAKINVMNAHKEFYEYFSEARESMDEKLEALNIKVAEFNEMGGKAEQKLNKLSNFVDTLEEMANNYTEMRRSGAINEPKPAPKPIQPKLNQEEPPPLDLKRSKGYNRDLFQIPTQQQTLK